MVRHTLERAKLKLLRLQFGPSATVLCMLLSTVLAMSAQAQQAPTPTQSPPSVMTDQELAISVHNPFEDFVKVPVQSTTGFDLDPHHNAGDDLNIEPLVPISLNADWDLFARPSLDVSYLPSPHEQFGLGDLQTSFALSPAKATTWVWGVGPIFQFPTASSSQLGNRSMVCGPNRGARVLGGWVVQLHTRIPTDVVCRKSRARKRESDLHRA